MRFAALALFALASARANDTAATMGAGGLIPLHSSSIMMESEDLRISVHEIRVRYVFRNTSSRDIDLTVAFPLPEMDGGAVANIMINIPSQDPLNYMDFTVLAGGKRVEPRVETRAFFYGPEITRQLRALGLPLAVLDKSVTAAMNRLGSADRAKLTKNKWVDCSLTSDGRCWPYWQSRTQFYWTQRFPAHAAVEVEHTYRPVVGGGGIYRNDDVTTAVQPYCGGGDAVAGVARLKRMKPESNEEGALIAQRTIDYILTTANNWSGPIRSFRLALTADSADNIVLTCTPGLKRVAPTRNELVRSDFRPDREFQVLLLQLVK